MAGILDNINSIVLVMMENRSFDHLLGHLTIDNPALDINGLRVPFDQYNNKYKGTFFPIYSRDNDAELTADVPHEYDFVKTQLNLNQVNGNFGMSGFVQAYVDATKIPPNPQCEPMGYFPAPYLPMTDFLATNFCPCDNWFCPIPTSTQPNRTMAFSGDTPIFKTSLQLIDIGDNNIFDWLDKHNRVRWRVYHEGFSFFALYPKLWPRLLDPNGNFRRYEFLYADMMNEPIDQAPQVTIIEPVYEDAPHLGKQPDDNHAPLAVGWGEDFLRRTYQAITANPRKWRNTLMILYYDEHGGFYDHVPPPAVPYTTIGGGAHFESAGPRIPAILISPYVQAGQASHLVFDHTSVLQLLTEKFGQPGESWSPTVAARKLAGINSIQAALTTPSSFDPPTEPSIPIPATASQGTQLSSLPKSDTVQAFTNAGLELLQQHPQEAAATYPELVRWKNEIALPKNNP